MNDLTQGKRPEGYQFTLPTEAQWEYACRAGTASVQNNGRNVYQSMKEGPALNEFGWYIQNSGNTSHPVGKKQPNAWGIYDMHGNVLEWCCDWYAKYSDETMDPVGFIPSESRANRGGSWQSVANGCQASRRYNSSPDIRSSNLGFRIVLSPIQ